MNKALLFPVLLACLFLSTNVAAQQSGQTDSRRQALGLRISSGTNAAISHAITYKYFFNSTTALEALFSLPEPVALGAMLEKHKPFGPAGVSWYWGAGLYAGFGSSRRFGAQGAAGVDFRSPSIPLNLSIDWKPELNFSHKVSFEPAALGLSARFVF